MVIRQLRKRTDFAYKMDAAILCARILGHWLRDIAVLQLMEVLGSLMDAGYNLAEALGEAGQAVGNRAIRQSVRDLQNAVRRGEKFSRELERHGDMFPPIVSQLVIVGEQTGTLTRATSHIRDHLQREIERKTNIFVGTIEPTLTISLGCCDRRDSARHLSAHVRHGEHGEIRSGATMDQSSINGDARHALNAAFSLTELMAVLAHPRCPRRVDHPALSTQQDNSKAPPAMPIKAISNWK